MVTAIQPKSKKELSAYLGQPEALSRYMEIFPNERVAKSYIQSVLILVAGDDNLQDCTPQSIFISSLRAAALGLSCDKALKQAWLIPYDVKVKARKAKNAEGQEIVIPEHYEKQAQFQPHYLGLYHLAMRTGKYRVIHVTPVYKGTRVLENTLTGLHYIEEDGLISMPANPNAVYRDVTSRRKKSLEIIGWLAYFMTTKGAEKSEYMSCDEIEDHAAQYVKGYRDAKTGEIKNPNWKGEKREVMEMKTTFKKLTRWMDLSGEESRKLAEALQADESIDVTAEDAPIQAETIEPTPVSVSMTYEQARAVYSTIEGKALGDLDRDVLNGLYWSIETTDVQQDAIRLILKEEYQAEPPEQPKRSAAQNMKELGFE